jgi:hypothetical protein
MEQTDALKIVNRALNKVFRPSQKVSLKILKRNIGDYAPKWCLKRNIKAFALLLPGAY